VPANSRPLTVFAIPRAFERHIGIAQRNAVQSWLALDPKPRVILLGDDKGTRETSAEFGCTHIPRVECNEFGTPLLRSIFELAHQAAPGGLMLFVNADIILTSGLSQAISQCPETPFLLTGRRTHLIVRDELNFAGGAWEDVLARRVERKGALGGAGAMDYFIFPHGLFGRVPPFAIGRGWWDHWLAAEALRRGAMLIDASPTVLAVHQDHGFLATEESVRNLALFGQSNGDITLDLASHCIADGILQPANRPSPSFVRPRRAVATLLRRLASAVFPQT
jgi:hypothetical protein